MEAGLVYEGAKAFVTPRRLALAVHGVPVRQPDLREEKKGPRVGAPENAIAGFLKAAGLKSIAEAKVQPDKKGDFYVAVIEKPGRAAIDVIGEILPDVIKSFPWPKSMRWGAPSAEPGALTWVRPLHSIVATFGPETEEPDIVPFTVGGIAAGNETRGHRFLAPEPFTVRRLDDYHGRSSTRPRSCSTPSGGATSFSPRRSSLPSRKGSNWSRTTACSPKSPASSNGRWC